MISTFFLYRSRNLECSNRPSGKASFRYFDFKLRNDPRNSSENRKSDQTYFIAMTKHNLTQRLKKSKIYQKALKLSKSVNQLD
jgi:hypothetical protein